MTRILLILTSILALGCKKETSVPPAASETPIVAEKPADTSSVTAPPSEPASAPVPARQDPAPSPSPTAPVPATPPTVPDTPQAKSIPRFRNVSVRKGSDGRYQVVGEAMVFEAAFGYIVEDGHHELASGFGMASAGAPAWGKFSLTLDVPKKRHGSTLHLVLFESSPKDGSRQHEFAVRLP